MTIDPRVEERIGNNQAPKLKSNWMMSLPVIAKPKTFIYAILTKDTHENLGKVYWYGRTYIFEPDTDPKYITRFYRSCLKAIVQFIDDLMNERKEIRKRESKEDA